MQFVTLLHSISLMNTTSNRGYGTAANDNTEALLQG